MRIFIFIHPKWTLMAIISVQPCPAAGSHTERAAHTRLTAPPLTVRAVCVSQILQDFALDHDALSTGTSGLGAHTRRDFRLRQEG